MKNNHIVYLGDFDFRNENVQAFLVHNNGKVFNLLNYCVDFIGINRKAHKFRDLKQMTEMKLESQNTYYELPDTLNLLGVLLFPFVCGRLLKWIKRIKETGKISYVISYQAPTYSLVLLFVAMWCKKNNIPYIVNCADLPVFDNQPVIRRVIMKINWRTMHCVNKKHADGIIAVSHFIKRFYKDSNKPSAVIPPLFDEPALRNKKLTVGDAPVFLYAGTPFSLNNRIISENGMKDRLDKIVDLMIELENRHIPFRFDIVGLALDEYCACVPRQADALKNSGSILFHGKQPHDITLDMLTTADYMINYRDKNTMTEAGLSTKVVESVSLGTQVVTNDIGDTFLYLQEGVSGKKLTGLFDIDINTLVDLCKIPKEQRECNRYFIREKETFSVTNYVKVADAFFTDVRDSFLFNNHNRGRTLRCNNDS